MASETQVVDTALKPVLDVLNAGFWTHVDFWIFLAIGIGGLYFSIRAFREAKKARQAAIEAGTTVRIQTVTIDLTEVSQKLDKLRPEITFSEARDLLSETSRRLRRAVASFRKDPEFQGPIDTLISALDNAKAALNTVRPTDPSKETEVPQAVYFGIESSLAGINNAVADLMGLFESRSIGAGDDDAR